MLAEAAVRCGFVLGRTRALSPYLVMRTWPFESAKMGPLPDAARA
jgi:hypothetical protein